MAERMMLTVDKAGGAEGTAGISSGSRAGLGSRDVALMRGIVAMMDRTCRHFASDIDWQCDFVPSMSSHRWESEAGLGSFMVTENDLALRVGGYIRVDALPPADVVKVTAGCYDPYFNPVVVCEKSMALSEVDYRKLRELLDETHDKVTAYYVRRAT